MTTSYGPNGELRIRAAERARGCHGAPREREKLSDPANLVV